MEQESKRLTDIHIQTQRHTNTETHLHRDIDTERHTDMHTHTDTHRLQEGRQPCPGQKVKEHLPFSEDTPALSSHCTCRIGPSKMLSLGPPCWLSGKESACQHGRHGFHP